MLKVKVIAVGKCKEEWLKIAIGEYVKRLSFDAEIAWVETDANGQDKLIEENTVLLDPNGLKMNSLEFSRNLYKLFENHRSRISFAIGGPDGFSNTLPDHLRWSLSSLTFTHQLTRLVLIEQIYRAISIGKGSPYHK